MTTIPIAHYWAWDLEKLRFIGLLAQVLGLFFFLSLWWNGGRAWRIIRWLFIAYLAIIGLVRYALWLGYGLFSQSPTEAMHYFMIRSGAVGFALCIALIIFLIIDSLRNRPVFTHFGPEDWSREKPSSIQLTGLIIAILCIWSPFVPHPVTPFLSLFTFGFPTSFGVTLAPTLLFVAGLVVAGSRKNFPGLVIWLGSGAALSALLSEPITIHGVVIIFSGILFAAVGLRNRNTNRV